MIQRINDILSRIEQINERIHTFDSFLGKKRTSAAAAEKKDFSRTYETAKKELEASEDKSYENDIKKAADDTGLDKALIKAVIQQESSFHPDAVSRKGAIGLMQLMPDTARELGVQDPFNPRENIRGGSSYLKGLLQRYNGNIEFALAAYNAGPKRVDDAGGIPKIRETEQYVKRVMEYYKKYK